MVILMHLLFWMLSINCWNIVFNPGVETSGAIKGLQDYWFDLFCLTQCSSSTVVSLSSGVPNVQQNG